MICQIVKGTGRNLYLGSLSVDSIAWVIMNIRKDLARKSLCPFIEIVFSTLYIHSNDSPLKTLPVKSIN